MIKRIFWDIDETLIHTEVGSFGEGYDEKHFILPDDPHDYYTVIRPSSHSLIRFSRELVGKDNVYILTTSTRDYAERINELADWGFPTSQIFAREDLHEHRYSGSATSSNRAIADPNNVLIDNLPIRHNQNKCSFIGLVDSDRYLRVDDYYGINFPNETFEEDAKEFLTQLHND